jgi:hypothetical protein
MSATVGHAWKRLAVVHIAIAVAIMLWSATFGEKYFEWLAPITMGQLALLAIWLPFAKGRLAIRFVVFFVLGPIIAAIGLYLPLWKNQFGGLLVSGIVSSIANLIIVSLPLSFRSGWRLTLDYHGIVHRKPWQLSISAIFALTLLVALLLTLQRFVTSALGLPNDVSATTFPRVLYITLAVFVIIGVSALGLSLAVLSAVWSCLATGGHRSRLCATLVLIGLLAAFPMHLSGSPAHIQWARMIATSMLTVVLSLLYLRYCGLRIVNSSSEHALSTELASQLRAR